MKIEFGPNLRADDDLLRRVQNCQPAIEEEFATLATAIISLELVRDHKSRPLVKMDVTEFGKSVSTGFAPDELQFDNHFRARCHSLLGQVLSGSQENSCPQCQTDYGHTSLPFRCTTCHFQVVDSCPHCGQETSISLYRVIAPDLWQCPNCGTRLRARYADPLTRPDGHLSEPLVRLSEAVARVP